MPALPACLDDDGDCICETLDMVWFLLIVISIYTTMHAYLFWRVWAAFPGLGHWRWLVAALEMLMIATPLLIGFLDPWRRSWPARAAENVALYWVVVIFWFFMLMLLADGWNVGVRLIGLGLPQVKAALIPVRVALMIIGGLIAVGFTWGLVEARRVGVERVAVTVPTWPAGAKPIRIVQVSDMHLSGRTSLVQIETIAELVRAERPDVLVSTGDLVDGLKDSISRLAGPLAAIDAPLGKFAVLGNHELMHGVDESVAFHALAGMQVLRAESVLLEGRLRLAGVDHTGRRRFSEQEVRTNESAAVGEPSPGVATVLLKHEPDIDEASPGRFRLQLSGHTHNGQIFPFRYFVGLRYPRRVGRYELGKGSTLYVSPGTGTWGPRLRVLAPPKITVITLAPPG